MFRTDGEKKVSFSQLMQLARLVGDALSKMSVLRADFQNLLTNRAAIREIRKFVISWLPFRLKWEAAVVNGWIVIHTNIFRPEIDPRIKNCYVNSTDTDCLIRVELYVKEEEYPPEVQEIIFLPKITGLRCVATRMETSYNNDDRLVIRLSIVT